ncbi:type 1 fimbrial protein [Bordetella petrii]|nr:type 1 fimbrial protein [Bordetella petrii]
MKLSRIATLLAGAGILAGAQVASAAPDGKIDFTGKITDVTCTISVDGQGPDATVVLPTVGADTLAAAGQDTGWTGFTIKLSGCTGGPTVAGAHFQGGAAAVNSTTNNLVNTDISGTGAQNVEVRLRQIASNGGGQIIINGSHPQSTAFAFVGGVAEMRYEAGYYATGPAVAGDVAASVDYVVAYN